MRIQSLVYGDDVNLLGKKITHLIKNRIYTVRWQGIWSRS